MIIGIMNHRIDLHRLDTTPDAMGGRKPEWKKDSTVWAEFKKPAVAVVAQNGAVVSEMTREISIRYRKDVRRGWRVIYDGRIYDVEHTYDIGKNATIMVCREVAK